MLCIYFIHIISKLSFLFGAWYYTCKVKNLCVPPSTAVAPSLPDTEVQSDREILAAQLKSAYLNIFKAEEDLLFQNSSKIVHTGSIFKTSLDNIASFLKQHPLVTLTITAPYAEEEENLTKYENLGLARATLIRDLLVEQEVPTTQILLAASINNDLFSTEKANADFIDFKFSESYEALNESEVKAAYKAIDQLEKQSQFQENGDFVRFSAEPETYISQIDHYLNKNKAHLLRVNVPFTNEEEVIVDSIDIGLVRALDLKQQLLTVGIKKENVLIASREESGIFDDFGMSYPKMISYNFVFPSLNDVAALKEQKLENALSQLLTAETEENNIEEINNTEEESNTFANTEGETADISPIHFNSGSHHLPATQPVLSYVKDLQSFLAENPDKMLLITGHADDRGEEDFNFELGRIRAYAARRLLINYKVSPDKIKVISEGEFSPIASNNMEEGRRLNRRVEIDIQ